MLGPCANRFDDFRELVRLAKDQSLELVPYEDVEMKSWTPLNMTCHIPFPTVIIVRLALHEPCTIGQNTFCWLSCP